MLDQGAEPVAADRRLDGLLARVAAEGCCVAVVDPDGRLIGGIASRTWCGRSPPAPTCTPPRPRHVPSRQERSDGLERPKFPLDTLSDRGLDWLTDHGAWLTRAVSRAVSDWIDVLTTALVAVPPWIFIGLAAFGTYRIGGRRIGLLTLFGLLFLWDLRLWQATVETLVLVTLSTVTALVIGIPVGIWFALSQRAWRAFSPILDMMQTLPSFVYLIPALPFFGLGAVSACFATIVFSVPPVIG